MALVRTLKMEKGDRWMTSAFVIPKESYQKYALGVARSTKRISGTQTQPITLIICVSPYLNYVSLTHLLYDLESPTAKFKLSKSFDKMWLANVYSTRENAFFVIILRSKNKSSEPIGNLNLSIWSALR
jgi:hypothetical protein